MNRVIKYINAGDTNYLYIHNIVRVEDNKSYVLVTTVNGDNLTIFKDKNPDFLDRLIQGSYTV